MSPHWNCSHFFPRQYFCLKSFLFERYGPVAFISGVFDAPTQSGYPPAPENHPLPLVEKTPTSAHKFRYSIQQENIREAKKSRKIEKFSIFFFRNEVSPKLMNPGGICTTRPDKKMRAVRAVPRISLQGVVVIDLKYETDALWKLLRIELRPALPVFYPK